MIKQCKNCLAIKTTDDFYDGYAKCKQCVCDSVKAYRQKNIEKVREYDRNRPNAKQRAEYNKAYKKTKRGKALSIAANKEHQKRNPEKRKAHIAVNNAVRDGKLKKQPCEICGSKKVQAHHDDYSKPLTVRWLCIPCHSQHHRLENEKKRKNNDLYRY